MSARRVRVTMIPEGQQLFADGVEVTVGATFSGHARVTGKWTRTVTEGGRMPEPKAYGFEIVDEPPPNGVHVTFAMGERPDAAKLTELSPLTEAELVEIEARASAATFRKHDGDDPPDLSAELARWNAGRDRRRAQGWRDHHGRDRRSVPQGMRGALVNAPDPRCRCRPAFLAVAASHGVTEAHEVGCPLLNLHAPPPPPPPIWIGPFDVPRTWTVLLVESVTVRIEVTP